MPESMKFSVDCLDIIDLPEVFLRHGLEIGIGMQKCRIRASNTHEPFSGCLILQPGPKEGCLCKVIAELVQVQHESSFDFCNIHMDSRWLASKSCGIQEFCHRVRSRGDYRSRDRCSSSRVLEVDLKSFHEGLLILLLQKAHEDAQVKCKELFGQVTRASSRAGHRCT